VFSWFLTPLQTHSGALLAVGNIIATGSAWQARSILNHPDILPSLLALLSSPRSTVRKAACWTLRNMTHDPRRVRALISRRIIPALVRILSTDIDIAVRREAAWAIRNAAQAGNPRQVRVLAGTGCIRSLCDMLAPHVPDDPEVVRSALAALEAIFGSVGLAKPVSALRKTAHEVRSLAFRDSDGLLPTLRELRRHYDSDIRERSTRLVELYFDRWHPAPSDER
jgi:importin subunit alpha-5